MENNKATTVKTTTSNTAAATSTATTASTTKSTYSSIKKKIFVENLHQSVTVDDLYELFGFRSKNYLRNNCHTEMDHVSNADQLFASAILTALTHICEEP